MAGHIEYDTTGKPHPFHLVRPSVWPLLSAFSAGLMCVGFVYMQYQVRQFGPEDALGLKQMWLMFLGLGCVLACMFGWWRDVVFEGTVEKAHTQIAKIGFRFGMMLFILSELMFFVAFFWAFFNSSLYPVGGVWPPEGTHVIDAFDLPLMMTIILLLSGSTITWAHDAIIHGDQKQFLKALGLTVGLGALFLGFQVYEYMHAPFGFTDGIFSSTFFMATGFHGFHVLVGTIFLGVCWIRGKKGHFNKDEHFGFEAAAWYWHFVDVVWLFLFVAVYWWGGSGGEIAAH